MPGHFSTCAISVYQALIFPLPLKKKSQLALAIDRSDFLIVAHPHVVNFYPTSHVMHIL